MNRFMTTLSAGAVALLLSGGVYAAADAAPTPDQIAAAQTTADHEAIAAAFDQEAERLEVKAKEHEQMAAAYRSSGSKKGFDAASMRAHCAKLAKKYAEAAAENRELAKEHRAMKGHAAH